MRYSLGRHLFGLAAIALGLCAFAWHDITNWHQLKVLGDAANHEPLTYIVAALEILAGVAVQWPRFARAGAILLVAVYAVFALIAVPLIFERPWSYNGFGNFCEQLSLVAGALMLYAGSARAPRFARAAYYAFGVCVLSFGLEQLFYLSETASLVPKWIPPGQMFWAIATTIAVGLAAAALLTGLMARLASQLNTAMIAGFGLLVWVPLLIADPHSFVNWSEGLETLAIAASAWVVTEYLGEKRREMRG